jgi:DNA-directed RNA polymerase specialized sigma24 family protein
MTTSVLGSSETRERLVSLPTAGSKGDVLGARIIGRREVAPMDGDARSRLEAAYRGFGSELWRAIRVYSESRVTADDAVAEAFAQAAAGVDRIRDLRAWVFKTAFRLAAADLQSRSRMVSLDSWPEAESTEGSGSPGVIDALELAGRLSPLQRAVFVLRDLLQFSTYETARILDISDVAVRVHLHAAHRRLRTELGGEQGA